MAELRIHMCPHCKHAWAELVDADEYPNYCPSCGAPITGSETGLPNGIVVCDIPDVL